jgi:hypothetical protein
MSKPNRIAVWNSPAFGWHVLPEPWDKPLPPDAVIFVHEELFEQARQVALRQNRRAAPASPPPEPQEIWRARADAAVEALAFLAAHRRWDDGEHSMRVYAQEQLQSIARGEYLPPEPQGTDEERRG